MEDLLKLGVLGDEDFVRLLRCMIATKDATTNLCEVVKSVVEARNAASPGVINPLISRLYCDIFNQWLIPPLLKILLKYSTKTSKDSSLPPDNEINPKTSDGRSGASIVLSHSTSEDEAGTQECFSEPKESSTLIQYTEIDYITKSCDLAAVILKTLCGVHRDVLCAQDLDDLNVNSEVQAIPKSLNRVLEAIAAGFHMELKDALSEEKRHNINLLSLAFSNLLCDWCWVEVTGCECGARQVVMAALSIMEVCHDPDITGILFTLVIESFTTSRTADKSEILQKVWGLLYSLYSVEEDGVVVERSSVGLVVLCFLSDFISDGEIFKWINIDAKFWAILQHNLAHNDHFSRKRGRYVLRKCVPLNQYYCGKHSSEYLPWPEGKRELIIQLWNEYILLLETLEEKQIHVVKPVLEKLDTLMSSCKKQLMHPSWGVVVLRRLLDQEGRTIRVWGAVKVLGLRLPRQVLEQGFLTFITHHLLPALSDYSLYSREPDQQGGEPSRIGSQIPTFLSHVVSVLDSVHKHKFMATLLEKLFDGQPWGGIPLFYLVRSLALLPPIPAWTFSQTKKAAVNLEACLSTHEIGLRSASQCDFLRAILRHSCPSTSFLDLCHLISHLRQQESWQRGTTTWQTLLEDVKGQPESRQDRLCALQQAITKQLNRKSQSGVQPHDVALGLCLVVEESGEDVREALAPLVVFLEDCHLRPYLDPSGRVRAVQLLTSMLKILCDSSHETSSCLEQPLAGLSEGLDCLLQLFVSQLSSYSQPHHLEDLLLYLELLKQCSGMGWSRAVAWRHYSDVLEGCHRLLKQQHQQQLVSASLGVVVLEHLLEHYFPAAPQHHQDEAALLFILHLGSLTQTRSLPGHQPSPATSRLLLVTPSSSWHCVELLLMAKEMWWQGKGADNVEDGVVKVLLECVGNAGRSTITHVFKVATALAPLLVKAGLWKEVVEAMWAASFEFRKGCDLYRGLIGCLTDLLYHTDALACSDCHASIIKISQELLKAGEGVQGMASHMAHSLALSLVKAGIGEPEWFKLLAKEVLVPLLMFGAVFRKQHRVVRDTLLFVGSCGDRYTTTTQSDSYSDCWARAVVLRYLLTLRLERAQDKVAAAAVVEGIKHQYAQASGHHRDFPNSQNHRYKTRLLQAFLLLVPLLNEAECSDCLAWVCEGLTCDHQQPSIRYLQEWGAALLPILHPSLYPALIHHHLKGVEVRMGCVGSFLAAITHVACTSSDPKVMSTALKHTLAWCTAQHFNTRLYAQVSLRKMWHHCEEQQMEGVLQEFRAVPLCLVQRGNTARNAINMLNDFYFKVFHPVHHFTLQTIFHDLPRLSLLADDEWMSVEFLLAVAGEEKLPLHTSLSFHNTDCPLTSAIPAPWVVKAAGEEQTPDEELTCEVRNVQKKIVPQKSSVCEVTRPHQTSSENRRGGLIVVATLVDKAANLGGLCRTCEAFGVRELVVASQSVLQDHTFNSLALTAHHWLPITEVRKEDLLAYLKAKQGEGYTLVGAEQTAQSISLEEFTFPQRTVVVLGNERAGVPCEVLQVLQASVQIPQSGIVRSLNVHVSGALFMWEYTRQTLTHSAGGGDCGRRK